MSLYRKYRPQTFTEVIGQPHVVATLEAAVATKKPAHAYLFSGGRGIGKTSLARILARALGVSEKDLYEIDAASHNGVDEIRALREGAATLPMESPFKVYVLDEVHMLSKGAFNALLKILEEPPQHVIFILATTDIHKVPETILSRCEVYTLQRPTRAMLTDLVLSVCASEKVKIDRSAAEIIALLGDGSFRDTLSILQQVLTGAQKQTVTEALVSERTGAPSHVLVRTILDAYIARDMQQALGVVHTATGQGTHIETLYTLLLEVIRAILVTRYAPTVGATLTQQYAPEMATWINSVAQSETTAHINAKLLKVFLEYGKDMRRTPYPHILLELALLESISPVPVK